MSLPKIAGPPLLVLLGASWFAAPVRAELSYPAAGGNPPAFRVALKTEESAAGAGRSQIQRLHLTLGTNQYACVVPAGFRVDASNPQKIVISDPTYACFITIRLTGRPAAGAKGLPAEACREMALGRFPGARIASESSESVGHLSGPSFDLQWKNSAGTDQSARLVFVSTPVGIVEFSLLAASNKFREGTVLFGSLLSSFRGSEGGKLELPAVSDKS
jgi:hypothetical protein